MRALVLNAQRAQEILPENVQVVQIEPKRTSIQDACAGATQIYDLFEPASPRQMGTAADIASSVMLSAIQNGSKVIIAEYLFKEANENRNLENEALSTHESEFARVVIVRFPQLFGPGIRSPLFWNVCAEVLDGDTAHWLGKLDVPRSYLYIEDAVSALELLGSSDSALGKIWNVAAPTPLTGREVIDLAFKACGRNGTASVWGRGLMLTARVLDSKARKFLDIPYDYYSPFVLDGNAFLESYPEFKFTPNDIAIARMLESYRQSSEETVTKSVASG